MVKELTNKQVFQIFVDLANKGITLESIEYYEIPLCDESFTRIFVNGLYECILRSGNQKWYEKRYTTKRISNKRKLLLTEDSIDYKFVGVVINETM